MMKRLAFLALALWFSAGSLSFAMARPCHEAAPPAAAAESAHDHCDMMAAPATAGPGTPDRPADTAPLHPACCCPGLAPAVVLPAMTSSPIFIPADAGGPLTDITAPSRLLIPEPPPPKA